MPPGRGPPPAEPAFISKWVSLPAALIVALCSGLSYLFSLYAPALKAEFGWTQAGIAGIGMAANLGGYASIPAGWLFDALTPYPRAGPRLVVAVGALLMAAGWGWLAAIAAGGPPVAYASAAAAAALGGFGATFLDTAALALAVANHPAHVGTAVGVTKAALGLSGACWATAWTAAAGAGGRPVASLLRGLAIAPPLVALAAAAGVNRVPFTQADEAAAAAEERAARVRARTARAGRWADAPPPPPPPLSRYRRRRPPAPPAARFATAGHTILAVAAYETAAALALRGGGGGGGAPPSSSSSPAPPLDPAARALLVAGLVGLVATLAAVPLGPGGGLWAVRSGAAPARPLDCVVGGEEEEEEEEGDEEEEEVDGDVCAVAIARPRPPSTSSSPATASDDDDDDEEAAAAGVGGGGGARGTPPAAPTAAADPGTPLLRPSLPPRPMERPPRSYTARQAVQRPAFAALAFICFAGMGAGLTVINNLGAIAASAAAATEGGGGGAALHAWGVPRPAWLAGAAGLGAGAAALAAAGGPGAPWALPLASAGAGAAFGGHWAVAAAALPELFGPPAFASIYAALQVAPAAGSVLLARGLAGKVYDRAAAAQGAPPGGECAGRACFGPTLLTLAALQAVGGAVAAGLAWRARAKYRRLGAWLRLREAEEEGGGGGG